MKKAELIAWRIKQQRNSLIFGIIIVPVFFVLCYFVFDIKFETVKLNDVIMPFIFIYTGFLTVLIKMLSTQRDILELIEESASNDRIDSTSVR